MLMDVWEMSVQYFSAQRILRCDADMLSERVAPLTTTISKVALLYAQCSVPASKYFKTVNVKNEERAIVFET